MTLPVLEPYIAGYLSYHKENEKKSKRQIIADSCSIKDMEGYEAQIMIGRVLYAVIAVITLFFTKNFISIPIFIGFLAAYRLSVIRLFGMAYLTAMLEKSGVTIAQWYFLFAPLVISLFGIFGKPLECFDTHYCKRTRYIVNTEALVSVFHNSQLYLSEVDRLIKNSECRFYYFRLPEELRNKYEFLINQAFTFHFNVKNNYCAATIFYVGKEKRAMLKTWNEYADCFIELTNTLQEIQHLINKLESDASFCAKNEQYNRRANQNHYHRTQTTVGAGNQSIHTMVKEQMFLGCTTKEMIEAQYKKLMKTFHPDMQNGNEDLAKVINEVKEQLLKEI